MRANKRHGMRVGLFDRGLDPEARRLAVDDASGVQLGIVDDDRAAVDRQAVIDARVRIRRPMRGSGAPVSVAAMRSPDRPAGAACVASTPREPRVASRRHVEATVGARRCDADERRTLDELPNQVVQPVGDLAGNELRRSTDNGAQLALVSDRPRRHLPSIAFVRKSIADRTSIAEVERMEHRSLGRTGCHVSRLCLGAMMFGAWATPTTTSRSASFTARSTRGSTSSTPPTSTTRGESEEIVGKALKGGATTSSSRRSAPPDERDRR